MDPAFWDALLFAGKMMINVGDIIRLSVVIEANVRFMPYWYAVCIFFLRSFRKNKRGNRYLIS